MDKGKVSTKRVLRNGTVVVNSTRPQSYVPKYYTVKECISKNIAANKYRSGNAIPSEHDLMEYFGVSRITIRRAIDDLVNEGLLYRVQGKGTYVSGAGFSEDLLSLMSCTQDIQNLGMTPTRKVISSSIVEPDAERRTVLNLGDGEAVFRLERIYYADDLPVNHTTTYLPSRLFPEIEQIDFSQNSLYEVLRKRYEVQLVEAFRTVQAVRANNDIARYLQISKASPVLFFSCVTTGEVHGRKIPIETFDCHYRSDKFKFYIRQAAGN